MGTDESMPPPMPYAAVMATGAASQLAGRAGVGSLTLPLLWLAVIQAVVIALNGLWARARRWERKAGPVHRHGRLGELTVPIGLAVLGTSVAGLGGSAAIGGSVGVVALAWGASVWVSARVVSRLVRESPVELRVDGLWFLAPATSLAVGVSTAAVLARTAGGGSSPLAGVMVAAVVLGAAGYVAVLGMAGWRLHHTGLERAAGASWWIAAGCGGLAAAAMGRGGAAASVDRLVTGTAALRFAVLVPWVIATVVLVPVVSASAWRLAHRRGPLGPGPWPPTFSTGVYALGTIQVVRFWHLPAAGAVADVAAVATMVLWAATIALRCRGALTATRKLRGT